MAAYVAAEGGNKNHNHSPDYLSQTFHQKVVHQQLKYLPIYLSMKMFEVLRRGL